MVEIVNYTYRDDKATELNVLLKKMLDNLECTSVGIDEEILDLTTDEINRSERNPFDLLNNLEDTCRYFELKTMSDTINPIIEDLRGILYSGSEFVPLLERKPQAPSVKRKDYPMWLMENVAPLVKQGLNQTECARKLDVDPTNLSKKSQVYGGWDNFVNMVNNLR